ncbi:MAG TPA: DUF5615 family PIN-like protein [Streptosporangiaceae bacterium]|nr:DUF5615 family PIN-like protein [Streptosporangiaceae bacterium]
MKLLLDEMLAPAIARELRARGHDVEAIAGHPGREALSDQDVLALARAEHRAVVTNNLRDFRPLHHEAISPGGAGDYGMIFIPGTYRRTRNDTGKIITALEAILTDHPGDTDLADGESWL